MSQLCYVPDWIQGSCKLKKGGFKVPKGHMFGKIIDWSNVNEFFSEGEILYLLNP